MFHLQKANNERNTSGKDTNKDFEGLENKQKEFLEFVLSKYIETGVEELDQEKLPDLLTAKIIILSVMPKRYLAESKISVPPLLDFKSICMNGKLEKRSINMKNLLYVILICWVTSDW